VQSRASPGPATAVSSNPANRGSRFRGNDPVGGCSIRGHTGSIPKAKDRESARMEGEGKYAVYILASRKYGALYIGVTGDLLGRVITHREELIPGFTSRYHIHNLVYAEFHDTPSSAIQREKQLKKWRRAWKIELIEKQNPQWFDLFDEIVG